MTVALRVVSKPVKTTRAKRIAREAPSTALVTRPSGVLVSNPFDPDARRKMIAELAYQYAVKRDFAPGGALADWLAAEAEIDARLCGETHQF